jgi:hypothetical protein
MPALFSDAAKAALLNKYARKVTRLWVYTELPHLPTAQSVEVTTLVRKWGLVEKPSTIQSNNWNVPRFTPSLLNVNGYFTEDGPESLWVQLGVEPRDCYLVRNKYVELTTGLYEMFDGYIGKINDIVLRAEGNQWVVDLSTTMAQDELLVTKITKETGDEIVIPKQAITGETAGWA